MSTKDEVVPVLIGTKVDMGLNAYVSGCIKKGVQSLFLFYDILSKASKDCLIKSLGLITGLRTVRCSCELHNTKQCL